jgi:hypothetical protein
VPQIPFFTNDIAVPQAPAPPRADPAAFSQTGEVANQVANQTAQGLDEWEARYADAKRQANASDIVAGATKALGEKQFEWSKNPDHEAAVAGFGSDADAITKTALGQSSDPLVQGYVQRQLEQDVALRTADVRTASFGVESSARRGSIVAHGFQYAQEAAATTDPLVQAHLYDQYNAEVKGAVAAGWMRPEEGQQQLIQFNNTIQKTLALRDMNADPAGSAAKLSDPNSYPGLLPEERAQLAITAKKFSFYTERIAVAQQAHADAVADRTLRQAQQQTVGDLMVRVANGEDVSPLEIATAERNGQISQSGAAATEAAIARRNAGTDKPQPTLDLWSGVASGSTTHDDVNHALANGDISTRTAIALSRGLDARDKGVWNEQTKASFAELKTALSGSAIERGIFGSDKAAETALWTRAQAEFNQRVGAGEDPRAVVTDMMPRYARQPVTAASLPIPRSGPVNNLADVNAAGARLFQLRQAGKISDGDYQREATLLTQWRQVYLRQAPPAAATPQRQAPPAVQQVYPSDSPPMVMNP